MKTRKLGKSGLLLSEIGLGCWQFGGDFGPISNENSNETMTAASAAGINFFDTADVYGGGKSEQLVGAYVSEKAPNTFVATKVGRDPLLYPNNYAIDDVRRCISASAERLNTKSIDLIQLHCVPTNILRNGTIFNTMEALRDEGLFKHWGASVESIEEAKICLDTDGLTSLQIIFNVFRQDAAWELLDEAQKKEIGIIVRLPLASGLLTGKFQKDHKFDESDHRNYNKDGAAFSVGETFNGIPFEKGIELLQSLGSIKPADYPLSNFALRWILDHDAVTTVIAGASRPEQAIQNAAACQLPPLSGSLHNDLREFYMREVREHIRTEI